MPLLEEAAHDAARLMRQADALDRRARALRCEASDLSYEAMELRTQAEQMTMHRVVVGAGGRAAGADAATPDPFMERVADVLKGAGPLAMADLTDHLNTSSTRVRAALARLEDDGRVVKSGIKRGTKYRLKEDGDDTPDNVREFQSYETLVRDVAVRLDTFEIVDMQRELPDLAEATIRRWVRRLEDRGIIASERVGTGKVYAYVPPPENAPASRPRSDTPEAIAMRSMTPTPFPRRGAAVAGAGRGERSGSSIVNALMREVRPLGLDIKRTAHKIVFMRDGVEIANCSSTPGASSLKETRRNLRKAGVPVAP